MDEKDRILSMFFRDLLVNGVITFSAIMVGEIVLGPAGVALGPVATTLTAYLSDAPSTWQSLRQNASFTDVIGFLIKLFVNHGISNPHMMYRYAVAISDFISRLFTQKHIGYRQ